MHKSNSLEHQLEVAKFEKLQLVHALGVLQTGDASLTHLRECLNKLPYGDMPILVELLDSWISLRDEVFHKEAAGKFLTKNDQDE